MESVSGRGPKTPPVFGGERIGRLLGGPPIFGRQVLSEQ